MTYRLLADLVVLVHLGFVLFVIGGAFLLLKWKRCAYVHVPATAWAVFVEMMGWVCPLTPLENWFRRRAGTDFYSTGFIDHYILPLLYPAELTRSIQIGLGILLLAVNVTIYSWIVVRLMKKT